MSHEILIKDLRQKSSDRIKQIWLEAEGKAEELRSLKRDELEQKKLKMVGQLKEIEGRIRAPIIHTVQRSVLAIEDESLVKLSERLYALTAAMLAQIRQHDYETIFTGLVREAPAISWEEIQVNPLDKELAMSLFPGADIKTEPSIIGGYCGCSEGGAYRVVNTLESRLKKGWPVILPRIVQEIIQEENAESAA